MDKFKTVVDYWDNRLILFERIIFANDPRRQFKLGFSITKFNGRIIKNINEISEKSLLETRISDGTIKSKVETISKNEEK